MGSLDKSNGRWIRNLDEQLTKTMADRVVAQGSDGIETILNIDIDAVLNRQGKYQAGADKEEDGMVAFNRLVGIAKVKEQVEQFVAMAEFNQNEQSKVVLWKIQRCTRSSWQLLVQGRRPLLVFWGIFSSKRSYQAEEITEVF